MKKTLIALVFCAVVGATACGGGPYGINPNAGGGGGTTPTITYKPGVSWGLGGFNATAAVKNTQTAMVLPGALKYIAAYLPLQTQDTQTVTLAGSYNGTCAQLPQTTSPVFVYNLGDPTSGCNRTGSLDLGPPVVGDGTITNLVVMANGQGVNDQSGLVTILVN